MADKTGITLRVSAAPLLSKGLIALIVSQQELERALPVELNKSGHTLFNDVVTEIARSFPEVPPQAIAAALTSREASGLVPSFVISSSDKMVGYVRWVTARDEKVCNICGPRDDRIYQMADAIDIWPAHPNCRCRLEALGISESMLSAGAALLPEAMIRVSDGMLEHFARVWTRF